MLRSAYHGERGRDGLVRKSVGEPGQALTLVGDSSRCQDSSLTLFHVLASKSCGR